MTSNILFNTPHDIYHYGICPYLTEKDFANLGAAGKNNEVFKYARDVAYGHRSEITKEEDALSLCVLDETINKIQKGINLAELHILDFDENDNLVLKKLSQFRIDHFSKLSFCKRIKAKYRFMQGEHHKKITQKVESILFLQAKVAKVFNTDVITVENSVNPWVKLEKRLHRIQKMVRTEQTLKDALKVSQRSYDVIKYLLGGFEKLIFRIMSLYHSICKHKVEVFDVHKTFTFTSLGTDILVYRNVGIKFGESTYMWEGKEHKVDIVANFDPYSSQIIPGKTYFFVREEGKGALCGLYLSKEKYLTNDRKYRIYVKYFDGGGSQDSSNGDLPFKRLLTKIAVEAFQREAVDLLSIGSNYRDADVLCAGGFDVAGPNLRNEIRAARANGRVYPAYRDLGGFSANLWKKPAAENGTVFESYDQPALVDFVLNQPPITWEQEIAERPLLKGQGSVIPAN